MNVPALFTKHQPIANAIASEYRIPGSEPQDVRQEALIALWEAARTYEPEHGTRFPNFARQVIHRRLADALKAALRGKQLVLTEAVRDLDTLALDDVCLAVLQRERVRSIMRAVEVMDGLERATLARIVNAVPLADKADDNARYMLRRRLKAAA